MRPKLAILCPMFKDCPVEFVQSLIRFLPKVPQDFQTYFLSSIGGYIPENRNLLVQQYIDAKNDIGKIDLVLWLDSDMVFEYKDLQKLYENMTLFNADMVTALYFAHRKGEKVHLAMIEKDGIYHSIPKEIIDKVPTVVNVDSAGLGFTLMKASVLDKMIEKQGNNRIFRFTENEHGFVGEDNDFFKRAKDAGFDLFLCPKIVVGHVKQITLGKEL